MEGAAEPLLTSAAPQSASLQLSAALWEPPKPVETLCPRFANRHDSEELLPASRQLREQRADRKTRQQRGGAAQPAVQLFHSKPTGPVRGIQIRKSPIVQVQHEEKPFGQKGEILISKC